VAGDWLSIQADWTTVFLFIILWYFLLVSWERRGVLDKWDSTRVFGIVMMVRTQRGKGLLEKASKPRRFWRWYGEVSLWVCWAAMAIVGLMMIIVFISALISPPQVDPPKVSEMIALPGVNPVIPLGWGALAFIVCLVIHEFGHGLLARGHGMRIRSFGLLMLGPIPLGAFAEPEHQEINQAPKRERQRMFAAGPATNIFAAVFLLLILGALTSQVVAAQPGVHAKGIIKDEGAEQAGMLPYDTITEINGSSISDVDDFSKVMENHHSGEVVNVTVIRQSDSSTEVLNVTLGDKHDHYLKLGWEEESLENLGIEEGDAFLGVEGLASGTAGVDRLAGPFGTRWDGSLGYTLLATPFHVLELLLTPFQNKGMAILPVEEAMLEPAEGGLAGLIGLVGIVFLVNLLFWLIWVNILLGFTNLLPMVPFDGGHIFRDVVHSFLSGISKLREKFSGKRMNPLWIDHAAGKISNLSSLFLLFALLFVMVSPYL